MSAPAVTIETARDPMNPSEVAAILRVGRTTIFELCRAGIIRHQKIGNGPRARILIYKVDLIDWIDSNKTGGRS
jgi:excisionase family DNA binding protein